MRVKLFNTWQSAQTTLAKKRETEVKLQAGGKPEKIAQNKQEIKDVSIIINYVLQKCMLCAKYIMYLHSCVFLHKYNVIMYNPVGT